MSESGILSYIHCRRCYEAGRRSKISVGLIDPLTARVWCATCSSRIVDLTLDQPVPLRCDQCGGEITKGHTH